ncbi:MAG: hypothetical protein IKE65_03940 [Clostridia bacterium]|nr:hypothetical protein [Clostridia bacterium]
MSNPILSKSNGEKLTSPDGLNDYIKVSHVSVWLILGVIFILLISVFVWSVFGSLKESVTTTGVASGGEVVCYLESAEGISQGDTVTIGNAYGKVVSVSETPLSAQELGEKYDDYTIYRLQPKEWNYEVKVECKDCENGLQTLKIIYSEIQPISFLKG